MITGGFYEPLENNHFLTILIAPLFPTVLNPCYSRRFENPCYSRQFENPRYSRRFENPYYF